MKIHKVYIGDKPLEDRHMAWAESWSRHHPGCDHVMWTNDLGLIPHGHPYSRVETLPSLTEPLIEQRLRESVPKPQLWAALSDVYRCQIVRDHGGLYADNDTACVRDTRPLFGPCELAVGRENSTAEACGNFLIWSRSPHHPVFRRYEDAVYRATSPRWGLVYRHPEQILEWTGPAALWRSIATHPDSQILPRSQVSVLQRGHRSPESDANAEWPPHVYVLHFLEGSWERTSRGKTLPNRKDINNERK